MIKTLGFGIISIFGIEELTVDRLTLVGSFGIISIFGIEEPQTCLRSWCISFGIISIFGREEPLAEVLQTPDVLVSSQFLV